jgi:nucleoside 2-deoxyribosyltransferase
MDGPDPDSGTCWECGYAYRKKPVVVFRTDFRGGHETLGERPELMKHNADAYNFMLIESAARRLDLPFTAVDGVADGIDRALENLPSAA